RLDDEVAQPAAGFTPEALADDHTDQREGDRRRERRERPRQRRGPDDRPHELTIGGAQEACRVNEIGVHRARALEGVDTLCDAVIGLPRAPTRTGRAVTANPAPARVAAPRKRRRVRVIRKAPRARIITY